MKAFLLRVKIKGEIKMKKNILSLMITAFTMASLTACGNDSKGTITVWVGGESVSYYQDVLNDFKKKNDFEYDFKVVESDAGDAAKVFLEDVEKGADIFTVAHDNLAKLTAGQSAIMPVTDQSLLNQIEADNPDVFKDVIKKEMHGNNYTFAVPYIGQALVLYYNKAVVSEEQAKTWEGLAEAAKNASSAGNVVKAFCG